MPKRKWSEERRDTLEEDLNILIGDLCVLCGYCNDLSGAKLVQDHPVLTDDAFACAVLIAEGLNPETSPDHKMIRNRFRMRYGSSISKRDYKGN
jgi:hypothetical protein